MVHVGPARRLHKSRDEVAVQYKAQYTLSTPTRDYELSRVGGVNAPIGSRGPVYNFLCC